MACLSRARQTWRGLHGCSCYCKVLIVQTSGCQMLIGGFRGTSVCILVRHGSDASVPPFAQTHLTVMQSFDRQPYEWTSRARIVLPGMWVTCTLMSLRRNLSVRGLQFHSGSEAMLYEIFNSVGPVASIRVCRDSVSRKCARETRKSRSDHRV